MSRSGPEVFAVVGDTDWWSTSLRSTDVLYDSRLRSVQRSATGYRSAFGAGARTPSASRGCYLEFGYSAGGAAQSMSGLMLASAASSMTGSQFWSHANGVSYDNGGGVIRQNTVAAQSGLSTFASTARLGVKLYLDGGAQKVQFYVGGVASGAPQTVAAGAYCFAWTGSSASGVDGSVYVDADDQRHRPADCDPWGAAARVADFGGYSPAASVLADLAGGVTIDSYGRTASATANQRSAAPAAYRNSGGYLYAECLVEVFPAATGFGGVFGLAPSTMTLATNPGNTSGGWGYLAVNGANGTAYFNGVPTDLGPAGRADTGARMGILWHVLTGKMWLLNNGVVLHSGNPEALTGEIYSGVAGALRPVLCPYSGGRQRLCTHAREQLYRPSYAEAWDGADILPEQHFAGRLDRGVRLTNGLSFAPWGRGSSSGAIGAVEADNADGYFDPLADYALRNQTVSLYEMADGIPVHAARGIFESCTFDGEDAVRFFCSDRSVILDKRIDQDVVAVGHVLNAPLTPVEGQPLIYRVASDRFFTISIVRDQGLSVLSWRRAEIGKAFGIERTVNPAGKQVVQFNSLRPTGVTLALANANFAAWTGDNPNNWTITETGAADNLVTQSGSAARFVWGSGAQVAARQGLFVPGTAIVRIVVSAYTSGDLIARRMSTSTGLQQSFGAFDITGPGTYCTALSNTSSVDSHFEIAAAAVGADVTISSVDVAYAESSASYVGALRYLLEYLGGLSTADHAEHSSLTALAGGLTQVGYWSDQRPTVRHVLDAIVNGWLVDYFTDARGVIKFAAFVTEPEAATPVAAFTASDIIGSVSVEDDTAPDLSDGAMIRRHWGVYAESELAGAVTSTDRTPLISPYVRNKLDLSESASAADAQAFDPFYVHAIGAPPLDRPHFPSTSNLELWDNPTAFLEKELFRLHRGYAKRRRRYTATVRISTARSVGLGDVVSLTFPRFGLSGGKNLQVVGVERVIGGPTVTYRLWG